MAKQAGISAAQLCKTLISDVKAGVFKPVYLLMGDEPYYPVDTPAARERLALYQAEVAKCPNLIVGGRLGEYKYYDMDQSVGKALAAAREHLHAF